MTDRSPYALTLDEALDGAPAAMCALASGSSGNCTALALASGEIVLIDAGLSPTRTRKTLEHRGADPTSITSALLTHLDTDHCHPGWAAARTKPAWSSLRFRIHDRHMGRAERSGILSAPCEPFTDAVELADTCRAGVKLMAHDSLGVACFRLRITDDKGSHDIGFATDCGRVNATMIEHLRAVDTLAIESNYDPDLQIASPRPEHLKRRIMGGSGHLSNPQSAHAVTRIAPRSHLVLLHLSRQCNTPELAAAEHGHTGLTRTITDQFVPTPWIRLTTSPRPTPAAIEPRPTQPSLFGAPGDA